MTAQTTHKAQGQLWIISAPSGGGKTSLIAEITRKMPEVVKSISHTTRPRRNGEIDGQHYYFVTPDIFASMKAHDEFLESAQVFHHAYGTSRNAVLSKINEGFDVILNIDWQGAQQVRQRFPEVKSIFLLPPSLEALQERLERRGQDCPEVIADRMEDARNQISHYVEFDYVLINDDFQKTAEQLMAIINASRQTLTRMQATLSELPYL